MTKIWDDTINLNADALVEEPANLTVSFTGIDTKEVSNTIPKDSVGALTTTSKATISAEDSLFKVAGFISKDLWKVKK